MWFCVSGCGLLRRFVLPTPSSIRIPSIPGCLKTLFSNIYLITDVDIKLKLILSALDQELCLTLSYPGPVFVKTNSSILLLPELECNCGQREREKETATGARLTNE